MAQQAFSESGARVYARSMLELANENGQAETLGAELRGIGEILSANPTFAEMLANPALGAEERKELLVRTFGGKVSPLLANLLGVLNSRGRAGMLGGVAAAYDVLLDAQLGKVEVDVTVAQRLGDEELEEVRRSVSASLGKNAVVRQHVDESIIGGLILRVQDRLIDASVKQQLQSIRRQLLASRPKSGAGLFSAETSTAVAGAARAY